MALPTTFKVDLTNCDREPIQIPGSIQPHGAMLVVSPLDYRVLFASANANELLGITGAIEPGADLIELIGADAAHTIRNASAKSGGGEIAGVELGMRLTHAKALVDMIVHRYKDRVLIEFEPSPDGGESAKDALDLTQTLVRRIGTETEIGTLAKSGARLVRAMLGYDRVMVYQFLHNGAGRVIAESKRADLQSFMGQHFPASDIPFQARRLYELNAIRMIANANYAPVPLNPPIKAGEQPVDMSFAQLRSVSPIHCEYLRKMGVHASLSISIIIDGALWGLISCHHDSPRIVPIPLRIGAELFGHYFSLQVSVAERRAHIIASGIARERLDKILAGLAADETLMEGLRENLPAFNALFDCDGVGIWAEDRWSSSGTAPEERTALDLVRYLAGEREAHPRSAPSKLGLWHTQDLNESTGSPEFGQAVAGVLAIPLTSTPRDYLLIFRSEEAHEIEWAGEPTKLTVSTMDGDRLTPRGSFETWREEVRGKCRPWTETDLAAADAVRTYLRDVFLKQNEITADARSRLEHRRRVLNDELNHRVKNIITLIKSIAVQTGAHAETVADFTASFEGRLRALAFAHDQSLSASVGGDLGTLIEAEAGLHRYGSGPDRVVTEGDKIQLNDRAFGVLALVVHELMTNAVKYGALSADEGQLKISWTLAEEGCVIRWTETGGPATSPPSRRGFGSKLIQTTMVYDLGGAVEIDFPVTGLTAKLTIPVKHAAIAKEGPALPAADAENLGPVASLAGLSVLLVEDQSLIALDTEELLRRLGAQEVRLSPDALHAVRSLSSYKPDVAVLDFNLGETTSEEVADHLVAMGIPFVFATGYGDSVMIPEHLRDVPIVRKPASAKGVLSQLYEAQRLLAGD
ncbi:HWE histidine kinase domain-containing protein (plasmid) [Novosphingobium sp. BL-8A]|uniref:HWE histidine kinase domain-containing protein n=1 Tax=Novosphingobium sp. BL-8A TaxID=3127639 RepID=UPI003756880F